MPALAVSEGFVVAAVVVAALTIGVYLVIASARTAAVTRRLDRLEREAGPEPAAAPPAAPGRTDADAPPAASTDPSAPVGAMPRGGGRP